MQGGRTPDRSDAPYRQFHETTGRRATDRALISVQTNPATSVPLVFKSFGGCADLGFDDAHHKSDRLLEGGVAAKFIEAVLS